MKLSIMRNYGLKARFLKIENGDKWRKIHINAQWVPRIHGLE
jgi:hypothetical protein